MRVTAKSVNERNDDMNTLSITLSVYRERSDDPYVIYLTPEQYFDLDPDEIADVDSVPVYSDLEKYLDDTTNVTKLALEIKNESDHKTLRIEKVYQNERRATVTTRSDYQGESVLYREIIYEAILPQTLVAKGSAYEISRFVVSGDTTECVYHGMFHHTDDATENEYRIV